MIILKGNYIRTGENCLEKTKCEDFFDLRFKQIGSCFWRVCFVDILMI